MRAGHVESYVGSYIAQSVTSGIAVDPSRHRPSRDVLHSRDQLHHGYFRRRLG